MSDKKTKESFIHQLIYNASVRIGGERSNRIAADSSHLY
jgi:hypothetical protein